MSLDLNRNQNISAEGKPLCNSLIQLTTKNHIAIFLDKRRVRQFPEILPMLKPMLLKIQKTAEHFLKLSH